MAASQIGAPAEEQKEDEDDEFNSWLTQVGTKFKTLGASERNCTLEHLIKLSEHPQLTYLSQCLEGFLKRDFLLLLPQEIAEMILDCMDAKTLVTCCQVSKYWEKAVNSCTPVWEKMCLSSGFTVTLKIYDALHYKQSFLHGRRRLISLKQGRAFQPMMLCGHMGRVMAIYYRQGRLATGSDDRSVRIWDCEKGICTHVIRTHSVADVKFDDKHVITASFDTTAACWDIESGTNLQVYQGHVAVVFSVDYSKSLNLLVTGSADSTVKIWSFNEGMLIRTLTHHRSSWINQIFLCCPDTGASYYVLSRDDSSIHFWQMSGDNQVEATDEWNSNGDLGIMPGWQFRKNTLWFAAIDSGQGCHIFKAELPEFQIKRHHLSCKYFSSLRDVENVARNLLGVGDAFDVTLSRKSTYNWFQPTIDVVQRTTKTSKVVASIKIPNEFRASKRGSTFTLGERGWLDGLDGFNDKGVFFATTLQNNNVYVLRWNPVDSSPGQGMGDVETERGPEPLDDVDHIEVDMLL